MPEFTLSLGTHLGHDLYARMDAFTRAYIEGLFFQFTGQGEDEDLENASVSDLSVRGLQILISDSLAFQAANAADLADCKAELDQCGHDFALTSCHAGTGFWDRGSKFYTPEQAKRLTDASHSFPEYGTSYDFRDLFNEIAMSPKEAWLYAATWGSFMRSGDPGACMYGFDERFCVQNEAHRAACLEWIGQCVSIVKEDPSNFDPEELDKLARLAAAVRDAASDGPVERSGLNAVAPPSFLVPVLR